MSKLTTELDKELADLRELVLSAPTFDRGVELLAHKQTDLIKAAHVLRQLGLDNAEIHKLLAPYTILS